MPTQPTSHLELQHVSQKPALPFSSDQGILSMLGFPFRSAQVPSAEPAAAEMMGLPHEVPLIHREGRPIFLSLSCTQ